jgi:hypothetical protein
VISAGLFIENRCRRREYGRVLECLFIAGDRDLMIGRGGDLRYECYRAES